MGTTVVTTSSEPETEPESEPEDETSSMPPASPSQCGSCMGCMWSHGLCYMDASKSYCESWSDNTLWRILGAGATAHIQVIQVLGLGLDPGRSVGSERRGRRALDCDSLCVFEVKRLATQSGHKYQGFFS